jgi:glycosyltransferase involved in cell wall biosynthesis
MTLKRLLVFALLSCAAIALSDATTSRSYAPSPAHIGEWEEWHWRQHVAVMSGNTFTEKLPSTHASPNAASSSAATANVAASASGVEIPDVVPSKDKSKNRPTLPASARNRPLVTLVMIVKNEIRSLPSTLNSVLSFVDRISILDTGSTDGSDLFIERWCAANLYADQWALHRGKFVDFSTTRNEALKLAGNISEFILFLNGDDRLVNGRAMRPYLEERRFLTAFEDSMYIVPIHYGGVSKGRSERISRSANHFVHNWPNDPMKHWRYEGVTHEVYVNQKALQAGLKIEYVPDDQFHIYHDISFDTKESKKERFELDVKLLLVDLRSDSATSKANRARNLFYLAQSYFNLEDYAQAYRWFQERLKSNYPRPTDPEADNEKSRSAAMMASAASRLGKSKEEVERLLLAAHNYCATGYSSMAVAKFLNDVLKNPTEAMRYARLSQQYISGRKEASMTCGDDQTLVQQQLPDLIARIEKELRAQGKDEL